MICPAPGGARRDHAGQPALPRAEDDDRVAKAQVGRRARPADARRERVEEHGDVGRDRCADRVQHRVRVQVHVLGVAAEQPRPDVGPEQSVAVDAAPAAALRAVAGTAELALPAGDQRLDRDAVAGRHAPALGGALADLVDHAERLVAGDRRPAGPAHLVKAPVVLLDVAAADPAELHPQQRVVRTHPRSRELVDLERPRPGLNHCAARGGPGGHRARRYLRPPATRTGASASTTHARQG